ncbi:MAG: acylphosphatase [Clostridia bacterium]|nr:acylphosphatase [Clostridia bacterium]
MIRKRIVFYGSVQGVGFRWRALHAANAYGCTGRCQNEWDGSVTMEIQGTEEQIDSVITAIEKGTYVRIETMSVRTLPVDPDERDFRTE